ncbi:hypothetical protein [Pandoraea commovens]|uniref:Transmembrane protein n=1 Tax=Pandoraea commovens TaxID=2508289 RepID=A0ABY5Q984_9BURK|nr:hypothetical protein [Pandoraea commovens]UVA77139.1 hypothetical protein NTU39_00345 [Pandoraea commovens]
MERIYEIWKVYALTIVNAWSAYTEKTDEWGWPVLATLAIPFGLLAGSALFLPLWAHTVIFLAIALPFVWLVAAMLHASRPQR